MLNDIANLTSELIAFRSVSGEEGRICQFVAQVLSGHSLTVELIEVEPQRWNVLAYRSGLELILSTHLDVVPGLDEQFEPRLESGRLFGRGACDAKGIVAAMIYAYLALPFNIQDRCGLLFVVGEEKNGVGAKAAAMHLAGRGIRFVVNGEPTDCRLARSHKGMLAFRARTAGRACHSGYPDQGVDANKALIQNLARLYEIDLGHDDIMGDGTINIGKITGGSAINVISPYAEAEVCIRCVNEPSIIENQVRVVLDDSVSMDVLVKFSAPQLEVIPGFETTIVSFGTDIPNYSSLGATTLLYGPGSIHVAHTDQEYVNVEDLVVAFEGYQRIVLQLCSRVP